MNYAMLSETFVDVNFLPVYTVNGHVGWVGGCVHTHARSNKTVPIFAVNMLIVETNLAPFV